MKKEFDQWNDIKKKVDGNDEYLPLYHARQIRWCRLGVNVGYEQDGTGEEFSRPVLILRAFNRHVCLIAPLTTAKKKNKYHQLIGEVKGRTAAVIISQVRLIDTKRLDQHIATLEKKTFGKIRKAAKDLL